MSTLDIFSASVTFDEAIYTKENFIKKLVKRIRKLNK